MVLGFLELMQTPSGLLCPSWLFQSFLFLSLIYRCPHFMFLSKLGTCPAILSMQLLSVLIQPQPPATLPSVHGWVSTLSFFLVGHMALGGSFHQRLELWWGCAAGRSALFNTYVHSWKCVDKNCFPVFPEGYMPVSELRVLSRKGGWEQVSLLPWDPQEHSSAVSLLACLLFPIFLSCVLLSACPGYRGLSVQPGVKVFRLKPGGSVVSLPS